MSEQIDIDSVYQLLYATDASIYQLAPLAITAPVDSLAVLQVMAQAQQAQQHILSRGAGRRGLDACSSQVWSAQS